MSQRESKMIKNLFKGKKKTYALVESDYIKNFFQAFLKGKANGFSMDALLEDDFFKSIDLLLKKRMYVSSLKLMMVAIDTIAYTQYLNQNPNSFKDWVDRYVDLAKLHVSADELWELRNGIIHMSNLSSRKVIKNKVDQLKPYIGPTPTHHTPNSKWLDLEELKRQVHKAIENYLMEIAVEIVFDAQNNTVTFQEFFNRYSNILSDSRMTVDGVTTDVYGREFKLGKNWQHKWLNLKTYLRL